MSEGESLRFRSREEGVANIEVTVNRMDLKLEEERPRVFYLCNGEKEDCGKNTCYKNGGDCRHTRDVRYAKNFYDERPTKKIYSFREKEKRQPERMEKGRLEKELEKKFEQIDKKVTEVAWIILLSMITSVITIFLLTK